MKEINLDWWSTTTIKFEVSMNGSNLRPHDSHSIKPVQFWSSTKSEIVSLFCAMFSDSEYRGLYKAGKVECAEYAKLILKAYVDREMELNVCLSCIELIRSENLRPYNDFLTVRLIGKKLCDIWKKIFERNSFSFHSSIERVLEIQFSNLDNEPFISFMKDNERDLNRLVRDYENFRKPDFL